jgi:alanine racemase
MAVVKADGYGHGSVPVARAAAAGGASSFGVATLQEGVELRQAGLRQPVLVLGNLTQPEELRACLHWQLMPTLSGMREALLCQNLAAGSGRPMAVQLKLDTGMARLGAPWQEGRRIVEAITALDAIPTWRMPMPPVPVWIRSPASSSSALSRCSPRCSRPA